MRPEERAELVAQYLSRGGTIQRVPEPEPPSADGLLAYLETRNAPVYATFKDGEVRYRYRAQAVSYEKLVSIANRTRRRRGLPLFQRDGTLAH
jgi:hypothetical protein